MKNELTPVSKMQKGDVFPVEMDGKRYWAMLDEYTADGPVVSLYDSEDTEDFPVDAAIDDWTEEMWEAVRVKEEQL